MTSQYRAAVIGLGRIASTFDDEQGPWSIWRGPHAHTPSYLAAGVPVVAGADPHDGQRNAYAKKWGSNSLYRDYKEMLQQEKPDILSVCTTAKPRARILLDAVEIGAANGLKAIWAEIPMALSLDDADRMIQACRDTGIVLAIGCTRSWHAGFNRMRELIEVGELGDLLQVIGLAQCGLSHNGSHLLATINYLAGARVQWVFGHLSSDTAAASDEDPQGNGYLHYTNGVSGFVRTLACGAADWDIEVIGSKGRLRSLNNAEQVEFWKLTPSTLEGRRMEPAQHIFPLPTSNENANVRCVRDPALCIESGKAPNCSGEDGLHALEIAIALRESHRRGGTRVGLPMADRSLHIRSRETLLGDEPATVRRARAAAEPSIPS